MWEIGYLESLPPLARPKLWKLTHIEIGINSDIGEDVDAYMLMYMLSTTIVKMTTNT